MSGDQKGPGNPSSGVVSTLASNPGQPAGGQQGVPQVASPGDRVTLWLGVGVAVLIITLEAVMIALTRGRLLQAHQVVLFVGVALVTGLLFWLFAPAPAEVTLPQMGIRLAGGAAIGAAFMLLTYCLTASKSNVVVIPVPNRVQGDFKITNLSNDDIRDVAVVHTTNCRMVFVEFRPGKEVGQIHLEYLQPGGPIRAVTYEATLRGDLSEMNDSHAGETQ